MSMMQWSDDAFAGYLAAFIDGEGHIQILNVPRKYGGVYEMARIRLTNTCYRTLNAIAERLGYGVVKSYDQSANKFAKKKIYALEITSAENVLKVFDVCGRFIYMKKEAMENSVRISQSLIRNREETKRKKHNEAERILQLLEEGIPQKEIGRICGVSQGKVSNIKLGKTLYAQTKE